ncbi:hypothetical protein EV663_106148 [Rhodovulum bhavnagarense]|uniref:FlgN protein n=1 Tax=Rhodovulum bhavnagarense TaxID=992286 RepID=A0A4R2RCR5_9RHOB|nr:hypothetical protein [Rhodovulum bhavnagarense]TCP61200.1 hypothetical protein EV663_106148 [Rhodovulum bhavnagarense]
MTPAEDLLAVLLREQQALRLADFDALARIAHEKERLADRLAEAPRPDPAMRAHLRDATRRNARLLDSVRRGLASAADHLARRGAAGGLRTYDSRGQRAALGGPSRDPIRRA